MLCSSLMEGWIDGRVDGIRKKKKKKKKKKQIGRPSACVCLCAYQRVAIYFVSTVLGRPPSLPPTAWAHPSVDCNGRLARPTLSRPAGDAGQPREPDEPCCQARSPPHCIQYMAKEERENRGRAIPRPATSDLCSKSTHDDARLATKEREKMTKENGGKKMVVWCRKERKRERERESNFVPGPRQSLDGWMEEEEGLFFADFVP
ncbi:hypothetical protein HDK90DRAFT_227003 [Phyllosticta capitalensis]|uniref:Uncharacterized protein n=1 Tax=Phyllosticta capitalensis TaxID=121624 RepID=A0ABR1YUI4_9PEZI